MGKVVKNKKEIKIRFCPKCKSTNIKWIGNKLGKIIGIVPRIRFLWGMQVNSIPEYTYKCLHCGYIGATPYINKKMKNKRGEILGMSFGMIFSIILIIAFVATAFYVIKYFINTSNCAQVGSFYTELQQEIDAMWNSEGGSKTFSAALPAGIKYVCFANFSASKNTNGLATAQRQIPNLAYDELFRYKSIKANIFAYPTKKSCQSFRYAFIQHATFEQNPQCHLNKDGKVLITLQKDTGEAFVRIKIYK